MHMREEFETNEFLLDDELEAPKKDEWAEDGEETDDEEEEEEKDPAAEEEEEI